MPISDEEAAGIHTGSSQSRTAVYQGGVFVSRTAYGVPYRLFDDDPFVFAEPAGATAYAGLLQAWCDGLVQADETIVVINTGSGLKDVRAAMEVTGDVRIIAPNLDAVRAVLAL